MLVAFAIIGGAWYIGGKQDFAALGKSGMNTKLLPRVGSAAPDFTVHDVQGNSVSLSSFKGQPVWLTFWGSWCPPCRAEMPDIETAFSQLQPKGVVLLAVSLDEPALTAWAFAARNHATFTILSDPTRSQTGQAYPIFNFPTHIFIGKDGTVKKVVLAPMSVADAVTYGSEIAAGT